MKKQCKPSLHIRLVSLLSLLAVIYAPCALSAGGNPEKGKELSFTCVACHGPDGNSPAPAFPNLAGQYADYLAHAIKSYQNGKRENPIMAPLVANLSEQDIEDLAAYFAAQTGLSVVKKPD